MDHAASIGVARYRSEKPGANAALGLGIEQFFAAQSGAEVMAERGGDFAIVAVVKWTSAQQAGDPPTE